MYYISEVSPLPPPFNLIPVEKIASAVRWLARRYNWLKKVSKWVAKPHRIHMQNDLNVTKLLKKELIFR